MIDAEDPAEKLLNQIAGQDDGEIINNQVNESPDIPEVNEIKSLEGSVRNEHEAQPEEKAGTEKDYPQADLEIENPDNADQFTNFERNDGALIDGSQNPSEPSDPDSFGNQEFDKDMQEM